MKKIDLTQISFLNVEGKEMKANIAKELGNLMYMQGKDIVEHELGSKVYHSADNAGKEADDAGKEADDAGEEADCTIEVNEQEEQTIIRFVEQSYPYVIIKAVKESFK